MKKILYLNTSTDLSDGDQIVRQKITERTIFWIIVIGMIYRIVFATFLPITLDEAASYYFTINSSFSDLLKISRSEVIPPVTYLIYKFFVFYKSEIGVRWIFIVLNFIALFYLFKITKDYFLTTLFFIFSAYLSYYGSIARMHSLNIFLSSAVCYYFLKIFEDKKILNVILFILFSSLMILNFYPTLALFFSFFLASVVFRNKMSVNFKKFILLFILGGVIILSLVFYLVLTSNISQKFSNFKIHSGLISLYIPFAFCFSEVIKYNELKTYKFLLFILLVVPLIHIFITAIKRNFYDFKFKIFLFISIISYLAIMIFSFKMPKLLLSPKYVIWLYPMFLYILIVGLKSTKNFFKVVFMLLFLFINILSVYNILYHNPEDWRKIYNIIAKNYNRNDMILFDAGYLYYPFAFYNNYVSQDKCVQLKPNITNNSELSFLKSERVWLVLGHNWGRESEYKNLISKKMKILEVFRIGDIEIILFSNEKNSVS